MENDDEHTIGTLCRGGFMKEEYSEEYQDLVRTFTDKGINQLKEILKDKKYKRLFAQILYRETLGMSPSDKVGVIQEIKKMLEQKDGSRKKS